MLKIEGVNDKKDATFYLGKRVAYIYRAHRKSKERGSKKPSKYRVMWGRVTRPHGNSGAVRAKIKSGSGLGTRLGMWVVEGGCGYVSVCLWWGE